MLFYLLMTLSEMAVEYRANNEIIKTRIAELKVELSAEKNAMLIMRLQRRIRILQSICNDNAAIAEYLEHYYEAQEENDESD